MGSKTEALAQRQQGATVTKFIERSKADIERLIPKHLGADRMLQMLTYTLKSDSELLQCSPASLASCVITAAALGLELNGPLGHAYLIPRMGKDGRQHANFQPGYKGLIQLMMRSGLYSGVDAEAVFETDVFEYQKGTNPSLKHVQSIKPGRKEKPPMAFYSVAYPRDGGTPTFKIMTLEDVMEVRASISYWESTPWATHPEAMALKTCIIRLCKLLPLASDANKAIAVEEAPSLQATIMGVNEVEFPVDDAPEPAKTQRSTRKKKEEPPVPENMDGFEDPDREPGMEG